MSQFLKNAPLLEAIFEVRWSVRDPTLQGIDPDYKFVAGCLYNKLKEEYPHYDGLSTVRVPDEFARNMVQHQFRKEKDGWPLVQVGPGVLTVNETKGYEWDDFRDRCKNMVSVFFDTHPNLESIDVNGLMLRYIDGICFDYGDGDVLDFIEENLHIDLELPTKALEECKIKSNPTNFNASFTYPLENPKGLLHSKIGKGVMEEKDAIIWQTNIQSVGDDTPKMPDDFEAWLESAHGIADKWFFGLLNDKFRKRFE